LECSLEFDAGEKLRVYASAGVPVYWILNLVNRRIEIHSDPESGGYQSRQDLALGDQVTVDVAGNEVGRITIGNLLP